MPAITLGCAFALLSSRGVPVVGDHRRCEKARELEWAVAVRCAHHRDLDALVAKSGDATCPLSFDRGSPFEFEAELAEELDRRCEVLDDDADVVHPLNRHVVLRSLRHSRRRDHLQVQPGVRPACSIHSCSSGR